MSRSYSLLSLPFDSCKLRRYNIDWKQVNTPNCINIAYNRPVLVVISKWKGIVIICDEMLCNLAGGYRFQFRCSRRVPLNIGNHLQENMASQHRRPFYLTLCGRVNLEFQNEITMNSWYCNHGNHCSINVVHLHYQATKQWPLNINMTSRGADTKMRGNPDDLVHE
jgi:hypothetical protein